MQKQELLDGLEAIITTVVECVREESVNIEFSNTNSPYYVKSHGTYYDIIEKSTNRILYRDLVDIDFVRLILKSRNDENFKITKQLLQMEKDYSKHINDMMFYVHSFKHSERQSEKEMYEHRFEVSKHRAMEIKNNLSSIRIILDK